MKGIFLPASLLALVIISIIGERLYRADPIVLQQEPSHEQ